MILPGNMVKIFKFFKENPIFLLLVLFSPLFFYKLGQSSLISWDEAWYAEVSRNIIKSGDPFNLFWNGSPFSDKPPGGFWLEAIAFKLFGVSNLTARLVSAFAGVFCVLVIYLLGTKLFNKLTGFICAVALTSTTWFLYRSRFGDLDTLLTLFYLLVIYLGFLARENKKFLLPFSLVLAYLPMIKGLVFLPSVIPAVLIIFWGNKTYKIKDYLIPIVASVGLFGIWILFQALHSPDLALYHFAHSLRNSSTDTDILINLKQFKDYLHDGMGRWFWPGILGVFLGFFLKNRGLLALSVFSLVYSVQFLFSPKVEIWHLIPLYPFMILSFFGSLNVIVERVNKQKRIMYLLILIFALYISLPQIKKMWFEFIDIPAFVTDEEILAKEAGKYPYPFYIDQSFEPSAVFYSGKDAHWENIYGLPQLFDHKSTFVLIVKQYMLDDLKINPKDYTILKKDRDKILILYQPIR
ncbi:MAG: glycosyltransferase family 39 protein [Candidatus Daviesbacteria bacterium]|nr:glycosyltransferase family 39 protein [Candidatus Daviesbacteria bacterium]